MNVCSYPTIAPSRRTPAGACSVFVTGRFAARPAEQEAYTMSSVRSVFQTDSVLPFRLCLTLSIPYW